MGQLHSALLIALLLIGFLSCARAEDAPDAAKAGPSATTTATGTAKERLGPKWSDEQRVDNCKVPIDKRGTKPRPSSCPGDAGE